ncbi:Nitrile-specifier protein 5 [Diplonema papillatum]|nr:Nitrile-specifier protein 5 [Diplonema papillatum]
MQIATAPLLRSSHSVAVVKGTIFIFGGEIKPRVPVDDKVYAVELSGGKHTALEAKGSSPCARVGHASGTIGSTFYVFGGRGGPVLDPLEENGTAWSNESYRRPSSPFFE